MDVKKFANHSSGFLLAFLKDVMPLKTKSFWQSGNEDGKLSFLQISELSWWGGKNTLLTFKTNLQKRYKSLHFMTPLRHINNALSWSLKHSTLNNTFEENKEAIPVVLTVSKHEQNQHRKSKDAVRGKDNNSQIANCTLTINWGKKLLKSIFMTALLKNVKVI